MAVNDDTIEDVDKVARFLRHMTEELKKARKKFPTNEDRAMALFEECGEVAEALLEHKYGSKSSAAVYKECVQTAVTALRLAVEGDSVYPYSIEEAEL